MTRPTGEPQVSRAAFWTILILLTISGAALRFWRLGEPSMWVDELFLVMHVAEEPGLDEYLRPLAYLPTAIGLELQGIDVDGLSPEGFHQWRDAGIDEATLRLPSAVIGVLSVLILGWLTQRLVDRRTALMLTALLAVSTWHLWISQTARFYVQQILFYNICLILYYDGTARRSVRTLLACALFFVLAFMTHLTSPMILGVFAVDAVVRRWLGQGARPGALGGLLWGVGLLVCAALVGWWYYKSSFTAAGHSALVIVGGTVLFVGVPVAVLALGAGLWLWRVDRRLAVFLLASIAVPVATMVVLGWLGHPVQTRYVRPSIYGWLLLAAIGLEAIRRTLRDNAGAALAWTPVLAIIGLGLFNDLAYFTGGYGYRPRWREAFEYVEQHRQPGERVLADTIPSFQARYYLRTDEVQEIRYHFSLKDLAPLDRPAWIVMQAMSPTSRGVYTRRIPPELDLKACYSHRIFQPYSSVHVYYYRPPDPPPR
ncbi:MAG TPA: glycosyltransferase family 39 protein [Phycisphaeraceae bacterium]